MVIALVVSGGKGVRMGTDIPKQFLALAGEQTILQATLGRVVSIEPFMPPLLVANARYEDEIRRQAPRG